MALLQQIKVPLLSVNDTSLTVVETLFETGEKVSTGDIVMVFETSKTTYDVIAENEGFIEYKCKAGEDYEVNQVVANIYSETSEILTPSKPALNGTLKHIEHFNPQPVTWEGETIFSKKANDLIDKHNYNRAAFNNKDFVSAEDVEMALGLKITVEEAPTQKAMPQKAAKQAPVPENISLQKISTNKKREIEYLSAVQSAGLTSTIYISVEIGGVFFNINQSLKYLKNSLLPVILYESSRLLKKHPLLNAFFKNDEIGVYNQVNMGFAIDADRGLKVLKIANTNTKTVNAIEEEIMHLSGLYLEDQLGINNLEEVTFTVTDLSSEGVYAFQPLINMNNSAILGVSAVDEKLERCNLSLTFDHRVTEGKRAAIFLGELKERLESYRLPNSAANLSQITCYKCHKTLAEDLSGIGFAKCMTVEGTEAYVCQSCFKGF